jgi:hypothetical protein
MFGAGFTDLLHESNVAFLAVIVFELGVESGSGRLDIGPQSNKGEAEQGRRSEQK